MYFWIRFITRLYRVLFLYKAGRGDWNTPVGSKRQSKRGLGTKAQARHNYDSGTEGGYKTWISNFKGIRDVSAEHILFVSVR